jgi:hypothetical protein
MHQNLTKHERFCKQNNQLPTRSRDELEDNSIVTEYYQNETIDSNWLMLC